MIKNNQIHSRSNSSDDRSQLDMFVLGFEYDKTLRQVKHDMKSRISKVI